MKKSLLILSFIMLSVVSFGQRLRTTAMFDSDTTTRPKTGFVGLGFRGGKLFGVPFSGNTYRILNANTHVGSNGQVLFTNGTLNYFKTLSLSDVGVSGLTMNYLPKWDGTIFVNSLAYGDGQNIGIKTTNPNPLSYASTITNLMIGGESTLGILSLGRSGSPFTNGTVGQLSFLNPSQTNKELARIRAIFSDATATSGSSIYFENRSSSESSLSTRAVISSEGSFGVGTTSLTGYSLRNSKTITGAPTSYAHMNDGVVQSGVTTEANYFMSSAATQAASFTNTTLNHFRAFQGTIGAGSTVTTQNGFMAGSSLIGATNNYGFRGSIASGSNRWNLYMDGTASNHLSGQTGIGTTSIDASAKLQVSSTTQGVLISRMTTAQRNSISSPATGLQVYDTDVNKIFIYNGTVWGTVGAISGSFSGVGTATTTFTVTIGTTMPNTTYKVNATPTSSLSAALFYVNNKTTTTFDVVYLTGLTGTVTFDYSVFR